MYWPLGAPRIYAASNSKASKDRILESDDDAESRETTEGSGSLLNAPSIGSEEGLDENDERRLSTAATPLTPLTPGIKPVEHDNQRRPSARIIGQDGSAPSFGSMQADQEPLLALRISRTGHLFAVITSTSLTIWQTKVNFHSNLAIPLLILCVANCHTCCSYTITEILEHLWSKCLPSRSTRLRDFRRSDDQWLPYHIHLGYRSRRASL
jgi:hypothetical protein